MGDNEKELTQEELQTGLEKELEGLPEAEVVQEDINQIKCLLDEKIKECEENYKRFLLVSADLDNYKKRSEREKEDISNFGNERLIKELIVVIDNLERALGHINTDTDAVLRNSVRDGVKLTLDQFLAILKKFGLEQVSAIGERFDPSKHEAINQEEDKDCEPGTVIKEYQKGYYLKDRLIRPAMVVVSKLPEGEVKTQD
ncbi:MAG: nucleotide exchange factor GrpE [Deltaproteobacteria bacterium]|nr:nucleotide exchange factor GrpE [Deltaproteobacteria bacterium]